MHYVYLLRSISFPDQRYVGATASLKARIQAHNAGQSVHTSKYKPWDVVAYFAFQDEQKAIAFEKYLKSGSGRAFANKHLW
jgi:predicted GIY-YIG superfamily endonuclease